MSALCSAGLRLHRGLLLLLLAWSSAGSSLDGSLSPSAGAGLPLAAQVAAGTYAPAGPMAPTATALQTSLPGTIDEVGPPFPRHALHTPLVEPAPLPRVPRTPLPTPHSSDKLTYDANAPPALPLIDR